MSAVYDEVIRTDCKWWIGEDREVSEGVCCEVKFTSCNGWDCLFTQSEVQYLTRRMLIR
jgi:hypothetical protein